MSKPEQITIFELQLISGCYRNICSGSISAGSHRRIAGERRNHRASFTLIELLIVIAIIAILACLLLPALNQARTRGHAAKCVSNQKQTMLAQIQYSNDYSGYMVVLVPYKSPGQWENWVSLLTREFSNTGALPRTKRGYLSSNVIRCPGNSSNPAKHDIFWGNYGFYKKSLTTERRDKMGDFLNSIDTSTLRQSILHHQTDETAKQNSSAGGYCRLRQQQQTRMGSVVLAAGQSRTAGICRQHRHLPRS